ncbi:hypothetical protein [Kitasatospora cineracea]|uniref:hypothetical protein n=1 Tax=Kitasatospora cineracea TaxID=88074 RepID=UPI0037FF5CEA
MELADRYGIPHSQLMGAGDGRWTALDRAKALAYTAFARQVCDGCGTRPQEWDEQAGGDRFAYIAATHRGPGCELIAAEQEQVPDGADGRGVRIGLTPRTE